MSRCPRSAGQAGWGGGGGACEEGVNLRPERPPVPPGQAAPGARDARNFPGSGVIHLARLGFTDNVNASNIYIFL